MPALAVQLGERSHASATGMIAPLLFVLGVALAGALAVPLTRLVAGRGRALLRGRRSRRRRATATTTAERRARAMMSELCPYGWRAQLALFDELAPGDGIRDAVALDWYELRPDGREPAVMRRVWAATVADALEAMVADRQTDEWLEQIELRASADGALWPDR